MIRLLIADDQDLVRKGLRMILDGEDDLTVVGEAGDGREAVVMAGRLAPDVILMDIRMPLLDGIEATREILCRDSSVRVLILTTFDLDDYVYEALRAGASGFLLKDAKADHLVDAVRTIHGGDALLAPSVTQRLITHFVASVPHRPDGAPLEVLTGREREILTLIAKGLSNQDISGALFISEGTVKTHVGRIFAKLNVRDRAQAVISAYESGLVTPSHSTESGG